MLLKSPGDNARASGCVGDFKECAPTLGKSTYNYAKAPDASILSALRSALGEPVIRRKVLRYAGFSLKNDGPVVCMEKARVKNPEFAAAKTATGASNPRPCFCEAGGLATWLRRRSHYRCGENGFHFATDREIRLVDHRRAHNGEKPDADPCFCSTNGTRMRHMGVLHYHCDVCYRSFQRPCRIKQHTLAPHTAHGPKEYNALG